MQIVGYYIHGKKQYVAFSEKSERSGRFKITDGFHDRSINEGNVSRYTDYRRVEKQDIDLKRIISRLHGARPWHPLLRVLRNECTEDPKACMVTE